MSKKVSISVKDPKKMLFTIEEDAQKGDYIDMNDLDRVDFSSFMEQYEILKDQKYKEAIQAREKDWIDRQKLELDKAKLEVEQAKNKEIEDLKSKIITLSSKLDQIEKIKNDEIKNQITLKELESQSKITELKYQISQIKENQNLLIRDELNKKTEELQKQKEKEIELAKKLQKEETKNHYKEILAIEKERFEETKKAKEDLENKYNAQLLRKSSYTTKDFGEDFESQIEYEIENVIAPLGEGSPYRYEKVTKTIDGQKSDFLIRYFYSGKEIGTLLIEAKSRVTETGSTKNKSWLSKIEKDRVNRGCEYALLVTQLDPEDNFLVKTDSEFPNIFIVRPEVMLQIIGLIYNITIKKYQIKAGEIEFMEKEKILNEFNEFKQDLLKIAKDRINDKVGGLIKEAEKIQKSALNIIDSIKDIQDFIDTKIVNKINRFSITNKIIKPIDKIQQKGDTVEEIVVLTEEQKMIE